MLERRLIKKMNSKLRLLKDKDHKKFWSIINDKKKQPIKEKQIETLYEYLKKMNSTGMTTEDPDLTHKSEEHFSDENIKSLKRESNEDLDKEITEKEVQWLIILFRNNKTCGFDKIFNEYLKYGTENIINLIVKIFNVILLKGIFPDN